MWGGLTARPSAGKQRGHRGILGREWLLPECLQSTSMQRNMSRAASPYDTTDFQWEAYFQLKSFNVFTASVQATIVRNVSTEKSSSQFPRAQSDVFKLLLLSNQRSQNPKNLLSETSRKSSKSKSRNYSELQFYIYAGSVFNFILETTLWSGYV